MMTAHTPLLEVNKETGKEEDILEQKLAIVVQLLGLLLAEGLLVIKS